MKAQSKRGWRARGKLTRRRRRKKPVVCFRGFPFQFLVVLPGQRTCRGCRRRRRLCPLHRICQPCHVAAIELPEPYRDREEVL